MRQELSGNFSRCKPKLLPFSLDSSTKLLISYLVAGGLTVSVLVKSDLLPQPKAAFLLESWLSQVQKALGHSGLGATNRFSFEKAWISLEVEVLAGWLRMLAEGVMENDIPFNFIQQKIFSIPIQHNNPASMPSATAAFRPSDYYIQMNRESSKKTTEDGQYQEEAKFLISNFRARENGLAIFLELFSIAGRSKVQSEQYRIYKQQFLEKQKIYTAQIRQIGEKLLSEMQTYSQIKHFWNKLRTVLRISQERIRTMGLLTESLAKRYEEVMGIVQGALEQGVQMKEFLRVEQLLRKRTVEALVTTKQLFIDHPLPDTIEANKNRSQTFLKFSNKPTDSVTFSPSNPKASNLRDQGEANSMNKLKSITRVKKKGEKLRMQISQTQAKKGQLQRNRAQSAWQRYERVIADVMDCKLQPQLDKKKSKAENQQKLYDQLFDRNIANHKEIAKYAHSCTKLKAILTQLSKAQKNRLVSQKKLNCGARPQADPKPQKPLLSRPKTSKKQKLPNGRTQSGQYKLLQVRA